MCGILATIQSDPTRIVNDDFKATWDALKAAVAARGPDASNSHKVVLAPNGRAHFELQFFASELWLRGDVPVIQPHIDGDDVLCWNGEVFSGLEMSPSENDGIRLFQCLRQLDEPDRLVDIFASIEGPYAFAYYHGASRRLYFGRDPLGRRSLLYQLPSLQDPRFLLTSVSIGNNMSYSLEEHPTEYFSCLDLNNTSTNDENVLVVCHRTIARTPLKLEIASSSIIAPAAVSGKVISFDCMLDSLDGTLPRELSSAVDGLLSCLSHSVREQVSDIPKCGQNGQARVAVLFSGGIDSSMVAFLASHHLPSDEPIDLLNVAFENPRKIRVRDELEADQTRTSKGRRRKELPSPQTDDKGYNYLVPDRVAGLEEMVELRKLCPNRRWNFVEINVTHEESLQGRAIVEALMHPSRTVMDLSLGLALYFASRGFGKVENGMGKQPYVSPARVLLNGLGSDELLGGYVRHRTAFNTGGWEAVVNELQEEVDRIPIRNLGRDDRVISSHGKETRHPFLSLSVVNYLCRLPVNVKLNPRLPLGVGDKMLLRLAARKEGLVIASGRKKRAMQFGTHSARMEGGEKERRGDLLV